MVKTGQILFYLDDSCIIDNLGQKFKVSLMEDLHERLSVSSSQSSTSPTQLSMLPSSPSSPSDSYSPQSIPRPLAIDYELWMMVEERIREILAVVQPTLVSDRSRKEIIDYVQTLIGGNHGIEVFSFGSVPLKTYLPDGDIDLTVLSHPNVEEELATQLCCVLEEDIEKDSDFQITDVQYIRAQVKVIKCNIRNIAVDISFNQMSGLCALCFLEQVDQLIGKDHLYKRSIVLIKAWCYYESRILGAHTGLISTYALSVLVLYIINLFHSSLCGPLAVLYKFLDYYGEFDWDRYSVTVSGPVAIASLPDILVAPSENDENELLLSQEFLRSCRELYSVQARAAEASANEFPIKHLNIVDPLKQNNNLGRSVTKGNFQRIRHAFSLGAQRLREILMQPDATMGFRLEKFFMNTLDRNGKGQREDVYEPVTAFGTGRTESSELGGDYDGYFNSVVYSQWYHGYTLSGTSPSSFTPALSQMQDTSAWDTMQCFTACQRNDIFWRASNVTTPEQTFSPRSSQPTSPSMSSHIAGKSRGTCAFIPDTSCLSALSYRDGHKNARARNSKVLPPLSSRTMPEQNDVQIEYSPEGSHNGENGDCSCDPRLDTKGKSAELESYHHDLSTVKSEDYFPSSGSSMNRSDGYSSSKYEQYSPSEKEIDHNNSNTSASGSDEENKHCSS